MAAGRREASISILKEEKAVMYSAQQRDEAGRDVFALRRASWLWKGSAT